jgi:hypothetical protein
MRVSSLRPTQWLKRPLVKFPRHFSAALISCYGQSSVLRKTLRPEDNRRGDYPSCRTSTWGANLSRGIFLVNTRQGPVRHFAVLTSLKAISRTNVIRPAAFSSPLRCRNRLRPRYVVSEQKSLSSRRFRHRRTSRTSLPTGKLNKRNLENSLCQSKVLVYDSDARQTFFATLRILQLNEHATSDMMWDFILANSVNLGILGTALSPSERSLLLEAFRAQVEEGFFENPLVTRSAIQLLSTMGLLDDNEWAFCIALMVKPVYHTLHGLDQKPVENRLALMFDIALPLDILLQAWEFFLNRQVVPSHTLQRSALPDTVARRHPVDTLQPTEQRNSLLYENRFLLQCGLESYDIHGITARRIVTASMMTLSAMTTWLAQTRQGSRLGFAANDFMGPSEALGGQVQFDVRNMSDPELHFMRNIIAAARGSSSNSIMLRVGLADMGLSPIHTSLLITSLRNHQMQSEAINFLASSGQGGEKRHPRARAVLALKDAIKQTVNVDQLSRIRDVTNKIHAKYPRADIDAVMPVLFRQFLILNAPGKAHELLADKRYSQPSMAYTGMIAAHYLRRNDLEGFECLCSISRGKKQLISDHLFERYCHLAGQDRALRVWLNEPALHSHPLFLRRALQYYSEQKDLENFEKAWQTGTRNFHWIPRDLQKTRMEFLTSYEQPVTVKRAIGEVMDSRMNAGRLNEKMLEPTSIQVWNSKIRSLLQQGNEEQAEIYLRLVGEPDANADTYRLFMHHYLAAGDLRASQKFAAKLRMKGEFPDDMDASRHLICNLEDLHIWTKQPMPREIYSAIQSAIEFRYGTRSELDILPTHWQIRPAEQELGSREQLVIDPRKRNLINKEHTYLTMLQALLDESYDWRFGKEDTDRGTNGDQDGKRKHGLRAGQSDVVTSRGPYTFAKRVRDALVLDNFRRRERAGIDVPRTEYYEWLLTTALFKLEKRYQLALLGREKLAQGFTHGIQCHYIWERFANQFLVQQLRQWDIPEDVLRAISGMQIRSFGSIKTRNLVRVGIKGHAADFIATKAASLQHNVWSAKLAELGRLTNLLANEIQHLRRIADENQLWERMVILTQNAIMMSSQTIETTANEFEDLQSHRPVNIIPHQSTPDLAYQWWTFKLQRAELWRKTGVNDFKDLERQWRDVKLVRALPPPKRHSSQMKPVFLAVRDAQRKARRRRVMVPRLSTKYELGTLPTRRSRQKFAPGRWSIVPWEFTQRLARRRYARRAAFRAAAGPVR